MVRPSHLAHSPPNPMTGIGFIIVAWTPVYAQSSSLVRTGNASKTSSFLLNVHTGPSRLTLSVQSHQFVGTPKRRLSRGGIAQQLAELACIFLTTRTHHSDGTMVQLRHTMALGHTTGTSATPLAQYSKLAIKTVWLRHAI